MKVIIAGSRDIFSAEAVALAMQQFTEQYCPHIYPKGGNGGSIPGRPSEIVSGGAAGVDAAGEKWASDRNIVVNVFPAQWDLYGKSAGPIRNKRMAEYADAAVVLWDGSSRGTANMIGLMRRMNKPVLVWRV